MNTRQIQRTHGKQTGQTEHYTAKHNVIENNKPEYAHERK